MLKKQITTDFFKNISRIIRILKISLSTILSAHNASQCNDYQSERYLLFSSSNFQLSCEQCIASQLLTIKTGDLALYARFCFATFCVLSQTSVFLRSRKSMSLTLPLRKVTKPLFRFPPKMVGISHNTIHFKTSGLCPLLLISTDAQ